MRIGRTALLAGVGVVAVAAGYVAFGLHPAAPVAVHYGTSRPAPSTSAAPASPAATPQVAGAATQAPVAAPKAASAPAAPHATTAPTPVPAAKLSVTINGHASLYAVPASRVTNACDILAAARDLGYLSSVTLDNSFYSTLHSAYVREINGYENNWTFTVNGASPKGCSLATVTQGDTVSWSYQ